MVGVKVLPGRSRGHPLESWMIIHSMVWHALHWDSAQRSCSASAEDITLENPENFSKEGNTECFIIAMMHPAPSITKERDLTLRKGERFSRSGSNDQHRVEPQIVMAGDEVGIYSSSPDPMKILSTSVVY
jgi:hypothetical protein